MGRHQEGVMPIQACLDGKWLILPEGRGPAGAVRPGRKAWTSIHATDIHPSWSCPNPLHLRRRTRPTVRLRLSKYYWIVGARTGPADRRRGGAMKTAQGEHDEDGAKEPQ